MAIRVLDYLPHAEARLADGDRPRIEVRRQGDLIAVLEARDAEEVLLDEPGILLRVAGDPEPGESGYVKVSVSEDEEGGEILFLPPGVRTPLGRGGLALRYALPVPSGAVPAGDTALPAMRFELSHGSRSASAWLFAGSESSARRAGALLAGLRPEMPAGAALMRLAPPVRHVAQYSADISVLANGEEVLREIVRVNAPLHYGGYHFYISEHDSKRQEWVLFAARSDAGLRLVFSGMALGVLGVVWACWFAPAVAARGRRRGANGT
jgi:hypothetical protein